MSKLDFNKFNNINIDFNELIHDKELLLIYQAANIKKSEEIRKLKKKIKVLRADIDRLNNYIKELRNTNMEYVRFINSINMDTYKDKYIKVHVIGKGE